MIYGNPSNNKGNYPPWHWGVTQWQTIYCICKAAAVYAMKWETVFMFGNWWCSSAEGLVQVMDTSKLCNFQIITFYFEDWNRANKIMFWCLIWHKTGAFKRFPYVVFMSYVIIWTTCKIEFVIFSWRMSFYYHYQVAQKPWTNP